ncbi:MAG: hypothetical protein CSYNP_01874 [Syntrophus sp. SKADARSKE-3]|nr:hypothetical protein [Syntrophus sp. SKADARSKE-3]
MRLRSSFEPVMFRREDRKMELAGYRLHLQRVKNLNERIQWNAIRTDGYAVIYFLANSPLMAISIGKSVLAGDCPGYFQAVMDMAAVSELLSILSMSSRILTGLSSQPSFSTEIIWLVILTAVVTGMASLISAYYFLSKSFDFQTEREITHTATVVQHTIKDSLARMKNNAISFSTRLDLAEAAEERMVNTCGIFSLKVFRILPKENVEVFEKPGAVLHMTISANQADNVIESYWQWHIEEGQMFQVASYETFQSGQIIFEEGSNGDWAYVVDEDEVEISKKMHDHKIIVEILKKGGIFGELAYIDKTPRSATATAKGTVVIGILDREFFDSEFNKLSADFQKVFKTIAYRLRKSTQKYVTGQKWEK